MNRGVSLEFIENSVDFLLENFWKLKLNLSQWMFH